MIRTIPICVRIEVDLKIELDKLRAEKGILTSFIINSAIREWLKKRAK